MSTKPRYKDGPAPVRAVPVSASQHSGVAKALQDSFVVEKRYVSAPSELVPGITMSNSSASQEFVSTIEQALKTATTERQLQDAVFNAMNALDNVSIPEECKKLPKDSELNFLERVVKFADPLAYAENDMKTILEMYANKYFNLDDAKVEKMQDAEPGLFVRAITSRPDIAAAVRSVQQDAGGDKEAGGIRNDGGYEMTLGEVKNADNFTVKDAETQEAAYLMLLLYWWRVFVGLDVHSVYGFTICGPLCAGLKMRKRTWRGLPVSDARYAINLYKLTLPEKLGGIPTLHIYKGVSTLADGRQEKIHWLFEFLTSSHLWENMKGANPILNSCASMFTAPKSFCQRLSSQAANWSMVRNGTSSVVFRCVGAHAVWDVLAMADPAIRQAADRWVKALNAVDQENDSRAFYVKVNTQATNRQYNGTQIVKLRARAHEAGDDDFVLTYPVDDIDGVTCYFLLMADRGKRVNPETTWSQEKFDTMFRDLWIRTTRLSLASNVYHGDIAHHNILLDKGPSGNDDKLVLIDWDEAQIANPKAREAPNGELYWELVYPEGLRGHPMLYTEMQLSILYWRLKSENVDQQSTRWWMDNLTAINGLQDYINTLTEINSLQEYTNTSSLATSSDQEQDEIKQLDAALGFVQVVKDQLRIR